MPEPDSESRLDRIKDVSRKFLGRTNEKIKQKIGRDDSFGTKDEKWAIHSANFNRQQAAASKLHREVKGYIASLRTLENSTQCLLDAVREMHEYTWPGNMDLVKAIQGLEKLTKEQSSSMLDTMLVPVNNYLDVFPDLKERMDKRDRKLLDYNRCKRQLDTIKSKDTIKEDKLGKAQEDYSQYRLIYEEVNSELCEDLPEFFNSRKHFLAKFLDGFFEKNKEFHKEHSQVYSEAHAALVPLHEACAADPLYTRDIANVEPYFTVTDAARKFKRQSLRKSFRKGSFRRSASMGAMSRKSADRDRSVPASMSNLSADPYNSSAPVQQAQHYSPKGSPMTTPARPKPPRSPRNEYMNDTVQKSEVDGSVQINDADSSFGSVRRREVAYRAGPRGDKSLTPFDATVSIEPGTQVECIHEYKAVDDDELSFVAGDVITVVAWDSPDEQDEGWFMGLLTGGAKGAFPINYTRLHKPPRVNGYLNIPEDDIGALGLDTVGEDKAEVKDDIKCEVKGEKLAEIDLGSSNEYDTVPDEDMNDFGTEEVPKKTEYENLPEVEEEKEKEDNKDYLNIEENNDDDADNYEAYSPPSYSTALLLTYPPALNQKPLPPPLQ